VVFIWFYPASVSRVQECIFSLKFFFSFSRIGAASQNVTDEMVKLKLALLLFFHVHEHSRLPGSWYSYSIGKELLYFLYVMQKNVVLICFVAAKKRLISYSAFFFLRKKGF
jgi:hypothetical protein